MKTLWGTFLFLTLIILQKNTCASHLIVGEMTYKHLGNNLYEFTLYYYRDCRSAAQGGGHPSALQSDNPAFISIFNGQTFFSLEEVEESGYTTLAESNLNGCETSPDSSCINRLKFAFKKQLPPSNLEYTVMTERCCMNESIMNIANPGKSGYRFYCTIPPSNKGINNSAVFAPVQDTKYCANRKYLINHSATDADGDSLSYGFALPESGGDINNPKPVVTGTLTNPIHLNYLPPYTVSYPVPGMSIDEKSGIISLLASIQGTFVVNIFCNEWRNGVLINTIKRTYIYTVRNCNFEVFAGISCDSNIYQATQGEVCISNCDNKTISFKNISTGAASYHWDFGVNTMQDDTSDIPEPVYVYTDTGRYRVVLIAYGNNCTDSVIQYVTVSNDVMSADFTTTGSLCTGNIVQFNSITASANDTVSYWKWTFTHPEISLISFDRHPAMQFQKAGMYTINLKAYNSKGCYAEMEKTIEITAFNVKAFTDTVVPTGTGINLYATGAENYLWYLIQPTMSSISSDNSESITFWCHETKAEASMVYVKGTNSDGCAGIDTVKLICTPGETIFVPNAFSPNGDLLNDEVKPFLSGYTLQYFRIYNRRGQQVFYTSDPRYGWNGTFNREPMGVDTYYWVASVVNRDKKGLIFKGDIVLVR